MEQMKQQELFDDTLAYIEFLMTSIETLVNNYHTGVSRNVVNGTVEITKGLVMTCDALVATASLHAMEIDFQYVNEVLNELSAAMEKSDYLYLVDLLEYELHPLLIVWQNQLMPN